MFVTSLRTFDETCSKISPPTKLLSPGTNPMSPGTNLRSFGTNKIQCPRRSRLLQSNKSKSLDIHDRKSKRLSK